MKRVLVIILLAIAGVTVLIGGLLSVVQGNVPEYAQYVQALNNQAEPTFWSSFLGLVFGKCFDLFVLGVSLFFLAILMMSMTGAWDLDVPAKVVLLIIGCVLIVIGLVSLIGGISGQVSMGRMVAAAADQAALEGLGDGAIISMLMKVTAATIHFGDLVVLACMRMRVMMIICGLLFIAVGALVIVKGMITGAKQAKLVYA